MREHNKFNHNAEVTSIGGVSGPIQLGTNLSMSGNTLNALAGGALHGRTVSAATVTMLDSDGIVNINYGAAVAIAGAASRTPWKLYTIKDSSGNAATNPITYTPNSGDIDGQASIMIQQGYDALTIYSDGTNEFTM